MPEELEPPVTEQEVAATPDQPEGEENTARQPKKYDLRILNPIFRKAYKISDLVHRNVRILELHYIDKMDDETICKIINQGFPNFTKVEPKNIIPILLETE